MDHPEQEVIDIEIQEPVEMGILHVLEKLVYTLADLIMIMFYNSISQVVSCILMDHHLSLGMRNVHLVIVRIDSSALLEASEIAELAGSRVRIGKLFGFTDSSADKKHDLDRDISHRGFPELL